MFVDMNSQLLSFIICLFEHPFKVPSALSLQLFLNIVAIELLFVLVY